MKSVENTMWNNRYLQGVLGLLALVLVVFVGAKTRNVLEEYDYIGKVVRDRDVISIEGTGKVTAKPDVAVIGLGVQSEGLSVKDVQASNTKKMNAIIGAVKAMGVADKDIQTSNYSLSPKIDWNDGRQNIIGYMITQTVTVKLRDLDKAGDVLAKAGELGMNQTGGIQFTIDEPKNLQERARTMAIEDARKKATQLADELGLDIVKVVTFSENNYGGMPVPMMAKAMMNTSIADAAPSPDIQSGSLDVMSNVVVTFEVR